MKNLTFILMLLLALGSAALRADNGKPIRTDQLPTAAQQFIKQHFAGHKIALAKAESGIASKSYEVIFADGGHIDFDNKGNWEEIDCKASAVPAGAVPAPIMKYIRENYPGTTVSKIEKDRQEYEVRLSNRVELSFDLKFNLTDIDM